MINYLCIIQARIGSTRLPNKVMQMVGDRTMLKRVWDSARGSRVDKLIVAWPERYPDLDENNVLERFKRIIKEFNPVNVVRLTSDCPLITSEDINNALDYFENSWVSYDPNKAYYCNHLDGHDVQVFNIKFLEYGNGIFTSKEHVINDFTPSTGNSVNTKEDLERVRSLCRDK